MAISKISYPVQSMDEAALSGIRYHLREALRKKFQEDLNKVVEEAIEEAMKTFETAIKHYYDYQFQEQIIKVILEDRRSK